MEESEDNMSSDDVRKVGSLAVKKPKKRSLVERELETNMTARITSPVAIGEGLSTSRYGRARRLKTNAELIESQKVILASIKSPTNENTPVKVQSPVYRMHASNSPQKIETPKKALVTYLDNQIDNIYQENISLSRFSDDSNTQSPAKKFPKVYIRKDLIQNREEEETIMLIQHLFSSSKGGSKPPNTAREASVQSTEKYIKQNGHVDNSSVVKTLDFDNKSKKKDDKEQKASLSKNELFEIEATCPYQVGDLAWARVGTFPFWPCIVTRDPYSEMFIKKKSFGRVPHDVLHVTFFGDNGRRSWIVDNMLRPYLGLQEFLSTREKFTSEDKKKDPRFYAAFFVSDKKQALWNTSVQEAETLMREPKRLRIDIFNDMLWKSRAAKKLTKSNKISTRTNSDVSLSESLYDSLFSDKEDKGDDTDHLKKSRNKSLDLSDVVTACLDNMAAKTGITKIQRQSHMDRWLQKAKSKTPEKAQAKSVVLNLEKPERAKKKSSPPIKLNRKTNFKIDTKPISSSPESHSKPYKFRKKTKFQSTLTKCMNQAEPSNIQNNENKSKAATPGDMNPTGHQENVDKENDFTQKISTVITIDDNDEVISTAISKNKLIAQNNVESVNENTFESKQTESAYEQVIDASTSIVMPIKDPNDVKKQVNPETLEENKGMLCVQEQHENENVSIDFSTDDHINSVSAQLINGLNTDTHHSPDTLSKSYVESAKEVKSKLIQNSITQMNTNDTQSIELSDGISNVAVQANCKKPDLNFQDSLMDVDNKTSEIESFENKNNKIFFCKLTSSSMTEVDNCGDSKNETNRDTNLDSKTVSNKNMGYNIVSDLKEAQNDVTIEVSVTEKNNDETIINVPREGEQKSIAKTNHFPLTETDFYNNTQIVTIDEINAPKNASTPEKIEIHKMNDEKPAKMLMRKISLENDFTISTLDNSGKIEEAETNSSTQKTSIKISDDDELHSQNIHVKNGGNNELNETGNSESILQLCTEDLAMEKDDSILDSSFNVSTHSESILENSQIDESAQLNNTMGKSFEDIRTRTESVTGENEKGSTHQYVESPTFTQSLDSEDFFRNVDDQHTNSYSLISGNSKLTTNPKKVEKHEQIVQGNEIISDIEDESSEDEPSPEYESLDDEITEDFRKHLMSIESNIKNRKDEEQIVKICNEIAEKAKLSPTKLVQLQEMFTLNEKTNTNSSNTPVRGLKENIVNMKANNTIDKKIVNDRSSLELQTKLNNYDTVNILDSGIKKTNESEELQVETTKDSKLSDYLSKTDICSVISENVAENTVQSKKVNTKINSNVALCEIPDKPKIVYRTRSSIGSATTECASPDIKIKSSVIEEYRKSCEYEPKVVIIRLECDKLDYSIRTSKSMLQGEEKSKNKAVDYCTKKYIEHVSKDVRSESKTCVENEDDTSKDKITTEITLDKNKNRKSRLSLRRKSKSSENNVFENKAEKKTFTEFIKEEIKTTTVKLPIHMENKNATKINETCAPKLVKVNGYHNIYRKFTYTPDSVSDTDFDVDTASLNSEDSEVSLPNSIESIPTRNLRSRPEKTLENALKSPEFLNYLEVRQDYLMDLHPELNADEVVSYVYKSWQYEETLKSGSKMIENIHKAETPVRIKKSKKPEPKNRIRDYFCEKYEKSKKTIDFDSESGAIANSTEALEQKLDIGTEKSRNAEVPVKQKKRSDSLETVNLNLDTSNDTLLVKNKYDTETVSVESEESLTPRRSSRCKTTPKSLSKEMYYLEDSSRVEEKNQKEQYPNDQLTLNKKVLKEKERKDINNEATHQEKIQNDNDFNDKMTPKEKIRQDRDVKKESTPNKGIWKEKDVNDKDTLKKQKDLNENVTIKEKTQKEKGLNEKSNPPEKLQKERSLKEKNTAKEKLNKEKEVNGKVIPSEKTQKKKQVNDNYTPNENKEKDIDLCEKVTLKEEIQKEKDLREKIKPEEKIEEERDLNEIVTPIEKTQKEKVVNEKTKCVKIQKQRDRRYSHILEEKLGRKKYVKETLISKQNIQKEDVIDTPEEKIQKARNLKDKAVPEDKIQDKGLEDNKLLSAKIQVEEDLDISTFEVKILKERDLKDTSMSEGKTQRARDIEDRPTAEGKSKDIIDHQENHGITRLQREVDIDSESMDSADSEIPLHQLRSKVLKENSVHEPIGVIIPEKGLEENVASKKAIVKVEGKDEPDETASTVSENEPLVKQKQKVFDKTGMNDPAFIQYLQLKQDSLMDENPQLSQEEIMQYLYKSWLYDEKAKDALDINNELVKLKTSPTDKIAPVKKVRQKQKIEKQTDCSETMPREKPRRRIAQPFYNENYSDIEDELEVFEIFKTKKSAITVVSKADTDKVKSPGTKTTQESPKTSAQGQARSAENRSEQGVEDGGDADEIERYFKELTKPKPNVFKGLIREKVCEICEYAGGLVKCKVCHGSFHPDCVKKQAQGREEAQESQLPLKGRRKKRKYVRKSKTEDPESQSDEKPVDVSADTSVEDVVPPELLSIDAEFIEAQLESRMKEILPSTDVNYDLYSSDECVGWGDSVPGRCEIVDVKLKRRDPPVEYSEFKCNSCRQHGTPVCFVCRRAGAARRHKCHVAHCHKHYHPECLDHWPQTQHAGGGLEALTCPRHVCHTCVSDDPRGCRTRFSGDKLAKCVRCPATYHSFNKCLPAGSQVLTASHIICPRHSEQKAGKVPYHVNTGWCFICALGGSLICCEYCPTSFHAECLNIKPPEGNYMCEDCETGRLPLYGEMVWVKLGQYRWWPGIILHPSEIPENIMAAKHELGDFVVRFFGQYDHYWVNRGRVFPYQEGDSGKISSQKSKINDDFICAIQHAQRAYAILKTAAPDEDESLDIESSLRPPHYVKLKSNKPSGALCGRRTEDPALSLTQCECDPAERDPCGPYSHCLNRMLLTECGPTCRAGDRCNNRAFEKRLYPRLAPYRTPQRGWGLKTLDDIRAGQFVIEYVGELIDEEEFRRRMRRKHEIRDENYYFLTLDKERMIDAGPKGNVARFMNHCCEPNCETQKWTVLGDVRVGLFAIRDIPANSEVTFNYNLQCAGIEKKRCLCGAPRCSGYIGAKPKQEESRSRKCKDSKLKRPYNKKKKPEESPAVNKAKKRLGRPPKPKPLTDLEKDVLIIKNATSLTRDVIKIQDKGLKKKITSLPTEHSCHSKEIKSLKRKRISISTEEVSICNEQEPCVKKHKCETSEVGD